MTATAISVPFHGNTLFVVERNGQPYTPMKPIVEGMGMDWASQFIKLKNRFATSVVEITMVAEDGKQRPMTCLAMRKLAGWLMTIYPNKVKAESREAIIRYQNECDDALWDYWTKGQATRQQNTDKLIEPTTLTASEQQTLSELVHRRVVDYGPNMGKALAEIWSRVHRKFRVAKYDQLPREQVSDVIAYIMAMEIKTSKPPQIEGPQPIPPVPVRNYAQVRAHMDNLRDWAQRALPESARLPFLSNLEDLDRCLIAGWTEMDEAILHLSLAASVLRRWRNLH